MTERAIATFATLLATLLAAVLAVATTAAAELRVVTTTTDLGWFAREVGGDRVRVDAIARGYQDPHYIEPKPSYIVKLRRADALFHVGLELEVGWLPPLLDGARNPDIQQGRPGLYSPAAAVDILERPSGAIDRAGGDVHPFGNPHYWLSPKNGAKIAVALGERLAQIDPDGADAYRRRAEALAARIAERDAAWRERLAPLRGRKLVTYHRTFSYFADHFGLTVADYIEPKPGVPPSARHLAGLLARVEREGVALLLVENFFEPRHGKLIAERTGVPLTIAAVSVGGEDDIDTWFDLIEALVSAVEETAATD